MMKIVAARHGDDVSRRREHVVAADGTVAIGGTLNASVARRELDRDANVAFLARSWLSASIYSFVQFRRSTLQCMKSFPKPSPRLQMPQSPQ